MIITVETPGAGYINVYINGRKHNYCLDVDDETGKAMALRVGEDGKPVVSYLEGDPDWGWNVLDYVGGVELEETMPGILDAIGWKGGRR